MRQKSKTALFHPLNTNKQWDQK